MSYTPTEWVTGDVVTAEKLNKLEGGVQEANQSGGGSGLMYFDISIEGTFPDTYLVSSKTYTEIMSAISSGLLPIAKFSYLDGTVVFTLSSYYDTAIQFISTAVIMPDEESADPPTLSVHFLAITNTNDVFMYNMRIAEVE